MEVKILTKTDGTGGRREYARKIGEKNSAGGLESLSENPIYWTERGEIIMKYVKLFFALLAGNLIAHYICKWLDKNVFAR